eukprot:GHRR01014767.1.p3 GENE.GHRR01014767.1~~GHRR01014767.1.p3  ORF type:complete len:115 (+),score=14.79 GHRR01014767.1:876-1220(+)
MAVSRIDSQSKQTTHTTWLEDRQDTINHEWNPHGSDALSSAPKSAQNCDAVALLVSGNTLLLNQQAAHLHLCCVHQYMPTHLRGNRIHDWHSKVLHHSSSAAPVVGATYSCPAE